LTAHTDLGIALPALDLNYRIKKESVFSLAIKHYRDKEAIDEKIRVLYVALSRAKEALYIIDVTTDYKENSFDSSVFDEHYYTSWILNTLEPSATYRIEEVELQPAYSKIKTSVRTNQEYPRYPHKEDDIHKFVAPSSLETREVSIDLHLNIQNNAADIGTHIHKIFESLPDKIWTASEIYEALGDHYQPYFSAFEAFSQSEIYHKMLEGDIYKELPFIVRTELNILHGYMDMVSVLKDEIIIVDFKTDRNVTEEILTERYQSQIDSYKQALSVIYPEKKISSYIYSLTLKEFISI